MYKALLRAFPIEIAMAIGWRLNNTNSSNGEATTMATSYDSNRSWTPARWANARKPTTFKLISYNILAQDLLLEHKILYPSIQEELLSWPCRQQNLQRELIQLNPDILCLQEIQCDHLAQFIQGLRLDRRLEYVFKKKTGFRTDGCAIVYDSAIFQLRDQQAVELFDPDVALLNRENVALFAKLRFKHYKPKDPKEFVVATTHLLYNPHRPDVRCAQVGRVLRELKTFVEDETPAVIAGDFNSEIFSSPMQLLIGGEGQRDSEELIREKKTLRFNLIDPGEGTASTHQYMWITVDHILRSLGPKHKHQLLPISVYSLPTVEDCRRVGPIPNHYLGSDHYALGAIFSVV